MTSFDGGGRAGDEPQPDGPSGGPVPPEDDPVRQAPPADPWLTDAATSVLGDATSLRGSGAVPPADTVPFACAAQEGGGAPHAGPVPGWEGGPPPPPQRRRATRWVVAVLAACALFVAGMLAIDLFGSGDDDGDASGPGPSAGPTAAPTRTGGGQRRTPAADPPSAPAGGEPGSSTGVAAPGTSAEPGAPEVVYQVTASGSRNVGSVSYTDQDGDIIRLGGIPLPWRTAFPRGAQRKPLVLIAQRKGGGDAGPVTCTITVDGKLLSSTTAEGRYAAPQCSGSGG